MNIVVEYTYLKAGQGIKFSCGINMAGFVQTVKLKYRNTCTMAHINTHKLACTYTHTQTHTDTYTYKNTCTHELKVHI